MQLSIAFLLSIIVSFTAAASVSNAKRDSIPGFNCDLWDALGKHLSSYISKAYTMFPGCIAALSPSVLACFVAAIQAGVG
jgi:hypothetical protein